MQLLVKMLRREVAVALPVELLHPRQLALWSTTGRHLADPTIAQAFLAILLIAITQSAEMSTRHSQQLAGFLGVQPPPAILREHSTA